MNQKKETKKKAEPQKKMPPNQRKIQDRGAMGGSVLRKNELPLIIVGALVVTVAVFFLFFRSSGPQTQKNGSNKAEPDLVSTLEKRIASLEAAVQELEALRDQTGSLKEQGVPGNVKKDLVRVHQDFARLENSVSLKYDALISRMAGLEKKLLAPGKSLVPAKQKTSKTVKPVLKTASKPPVKKPAIKSSKKTAMFHTVKKGETLWSISQKYKTTVPKLRKLNNLTPETKIYPGTNILIR